MIYAFEISTPPKGKGRPRFGKGKVYTPKRTADFERHVGLVARSKIRQPLTGAIRMELVFTFKTPKSWTKKKTAANLWRPHTQKPDLDNLEKAILDALNEIAFEDDCQVAEVTKRKLWGNTDKITVRIEPHDPHSVMTGVTWQP